MSKYRDPDNDWPCVLRAPIPIKGNVYVQFLDPATLEEIVGALERGELKLADLSKRTRHALEEAAK